jgi:hypothetical protein
LLPIASVTLGLVGCTSIPSVHCGTEGKGGGPGGCGFDMNFETTDNPKMPGDAGSPESKPPEPPRASKLPGS